MDMSDSHSKAKTIWIIVILFFIGVSNSVWGLLYFKQLDQKKQIDSQVSTLTTEKSALNTKVSSLEGRVKSLADAADTTDKTTWREVPELGLKYKVTDTTKDFTYLFSGTDKPGDTGSIQTSSKALSVSSYKAKNASGSTIDAYLCGLQGDGALSAASISIAKSLGTDQAKLSTVKSKKLSNGSYLIIQSGGAGNGSGTTDKNNALDPTPVNGCDKKLQDTALTIAQAVFDSAELN